MSTHVFRKKQWTHVHPSPWCVRLKARLWLLTLLTSDSQVRAKMHLDASSQKPSGPHTTWKCSCYCLWAGNRAGCFLMLPSEGVPKHWAPLSVNFNLHHAQQNHGSFWTMKAFLKKAQFPDLVSEHCFCSAMRVSYAGSTLHYLVCLWSIIACVPVRGSLRLSRSH